nr:hypothetical protein [Cytophagales bacterium]
MKRDKSSAMRDLYCDLMEEVKRRIAVVNSITAGLMPLPSIVAYETCYLQLRIICEIIALGCLAAHGDIPQTKSKRLLKAYNADDIIKNLEKLHPDFYPVPTRQICAPEKDKVGKVEAITEDYLQKSDLLKLYGECGNVLHRGNLKHILSQKERNISFKKIEAWVQKIMTLLNHHQIQLIDEDKMFWVLMQAKKDGRVHGALMEKMS